MKTLVDTPTRSIAKVASRKGAPTIAPIAISDDSPPIYQPEVAARAISYAADHPERREHWVGRSTLATVTANKVAAGLLDHYLARTGIEAQQTDQASASSVPTNLWEPADATIDVDAHGRFDHRSAARSYQLWAAHHHRIVIAAASGLAGLAALGLARLRRR